MAIIILNVLLNQAGVLLSLFTWCGRKKTGAVRAAETALRWASVALLVIMLLELLARAAAVGVTRFFRIKVHILDGAILVALLAVEVIVTDRAAEEALGLLVVLRLVRLFKLLSAVREYGSEAVSAARDGHVRELEARVGELQAELHAAEDKLAVCGASFTQLARGTPGSLTCR